MSILPGLEGYAKRDRALGQFDTHPDVARVFARWAGVRGLVVCEPCAGVGNIVAACRAEGASAVWAYEIDPERAAVSASSVADFLAISPRYLPHTIDVVAENPPYEDDGEVRFLEHSLTWAPRVCAIIRLVALASESRSEAWSRLHLTRCDVLVPRPVFAGSSGTDEIVFVEVTRDRSVPRRPLGWVRWREERAAIAAEKTGKQSALALTEDT